MQHRDPLVEREPREQVAGANGQGLVDPAEHRGLAGGVGGGIRIECRRSRCTEIIRRRLAPCSLLEVDADLARRIGAGDAVAGLQRPWCARVDGARGDHAASAADSERGRGLSRQARHRRHAVEAVGQLEAAERDAVRPVVVRTVLHRSEGSTVPGRTRSGTES